MEDAPTPEDRLLGGLLTGLMHWPAAVEAVVAALQPRHFTTAANRAAFGAVVALRQAGVPVDLVTVYQRLIGCGQIGEAGGAVRLSGLWMAACDPAEVGDLAEVLIREERPEPPPRAYVRDSAPLPTDEPAGEVSFDFGYNVSDAELNSAGGSIAAAVPGTFPSLSVIP